MTDTTSITIRDATREDGLVIRDIDNDALLHTTAVYRYEPLNLEERLCWFDEKTAHGWPILVAVDAGGDAIVGFCTVGPFRPSSAFLHALEDSASSSIAGSTSC